MLKTNIHQLRWEQHIKQEELAQKVGVRRETIGALERGKYNPSLKLAMDIAKVFGRTVEEVFEFVPSSREDEAERKEVKQTDNQ